MAQKPAAPAERQGNLLQRAALKIGSLFAQAGGGVALSLEDLQLGRWLGSSSGGYSSLTGHVIDDASTMRITTAFACVRIIAETVGQVTLAVYEKQKNGNAEKVDHPISALLVEKPNADMDGLEYREAKTTNLAARGNAYSIRSDWSSGEARTLDLVPSSRVTTKRKPDGSIAHVINDRGRTEELPASKIWHWKGFGYDGVVGLSPIACGAQALGLSLAGEEANARLFANGMFSTAVFKMATWPKADQLKQAEEKLAQLHAGLQNYGKPYLLPGGMEPTDSIFAPRDAQFLELRKMQVPEVCRIWRMSPHLVGDLERATNNNIEHLSLEFMMRTMSPYFRRIEEKARELFKPADRDRFFVRFNLESLLRADSVARAQLYTILLQNGVFSRNEVRALENRNRVDDPEMDKYTVQSNMALLDQLAKMNQANAGKPPAASNVAGAEGRSYEMPAITVKVPQQPAPIVYVHPQVVNVAAPQVNVTPPAVNVAAPVVNVAAPVVNVEQAPVQVDVLLPDRKSVSEIERDSKGNITRVTQNETSA